MIVDRVYFKIQWWKDDGVWIDYPGVTWESHSQASAALLDISMDGKYELLRVVKVTEEVHEGFE